MAIADRVVHGPADDDVRAAPSRRLPRTLSSNSGRAGRSTRSSSSSTLFAHTFAVPDVEVVVGTGHDWREAVESVSWETGDLLLLGSGAAGPTAQVFLGSAASKILRHAPVPVMIVPRHQLPA